VNYDITDHRHRFSVWAAARAAQRSFTSVDVLRDALEKCGVVDFLKAGGGAEDIDDGRFAQLHRTWCRSIVDHLMVRGLEGVTFGRAAKLIAIYLKSMVVLGPGGADTSFARVAHPPIDSILLRNCSKAQDIDSRHKRGLRGVRWTQLDEASYYNLIDQLRTVVPSPEPFWKIERFWTVTNDSES
jgi:hypothetical protein